MFLCVICRVCVCVCVFSYVCMCVYTDILLRHLSWPLTSHTRIPALQHACPHDMYFNTQNNNKNDQCYSHLLSSGIFKHAQVGVEREQAVAALCVVERLVRQDLVLDAAPLLQFARVSVRTRDPCVSALAFSTHTHTNTHKHTHTHTHPHPHPHPPPYTNRRTHTFKVPKGFQHRQRAHDRNP